MKDKKHAFAFAKENNFTCSKCGEFLRTYGFPRKDNDKVFWCANPNCIKEKQQIFRLKEIMSV